MMTVNVLHKINVLIVVYIFLTTNKINCNYLYKVPCTIRFYEKQYFMGHYWTLDSSGTWRSSRPSYLNVPYRYFQTKSIRTYGSNSCAWQICPLRTRKNFHVPRRKRCKISSGGKNLSSLRLWGWPQYILGYVYRLRNKRTRSRKLGRDAFETTTRSYKIDRRSNASPGTLCNIV